MTVRTAFETFQRLIKEGKEDLPVVLAPRCATEEKDVVFALEQEDGPPRIVLF